jgi:hypothetical protein
MPRPKPIRTTVCDSCGLAWIDHVSAAVARQRAADPDGVAGGPVRSADCVTLLLASRRGPQGFPGPVGPIGYAGPAGPPGRDGRDVGVIKHAAGDPIDHDPKPKLPATERHPYNPGSLTAGASHLSEVVSFPPCADCGGPRVSRLHSALSSRGPGL